jgi:hypothetical protein
MLGFALCRKALALMPEWPLWVKSGHMQYSGMSALGQKQTYAAQNVMSALPPIATAKAAPANGHVSLPPKADMCCAIWDVRFGPTADIASFIESPRRRERLTQEAL